MKCLCRPGEPEIAGDECVRCRVQCLDQIHGQIFDRDAVQREIDRLEQQHAYDVFLTAKSQSSSQSGFKPLWMPDFLFDFQKFLTEWAILRGHAAILADCGLGKGPMQLVWAQNVVQHTNAPVLIGAPLAVAAQLVREGEKFGIEVIRSSDGKHKAGAHVIVTNYDRLHYFDRSKYSGFVGEESSILKSFDGSLCSQITDFMRHLPYRLLVSATASPNDHIELGTQSEALGELGYMDMLNRFFKNDQNNSAVGRKYGEVVKWRFKGHAEIPFWRWVASWARAIRKPSDIGFDDGKFILPPLEEIVHMVDSDSMREGFLFKVPAVGPKEQREERRITIKERCEKVLELVSQQPGQSLIWCQLNPEGDLLSEIIPEAIQVSGSDSDEFKEEAFLSFAQGKIRRLVTKKKIGGWGMNWQNCNHVTDFPSHSYEGYYQGLRRCWRFGQKNPVRVDIISTEGERAILDNMQRKARQADEMFTALVKYMSSALHIERGTEHKTVQEIPSWLGATN